MTRKEAIKYLIKPVATSTEIGEEKQKEFEAYDMAIEALSEPKTIIGIDIPYGSDKGIATLFKGKDEKMVLEEVKEIMAVVRCKDCRWGDVLDSFDSGFCGYNNGLQGYITKDDYCSYGERRGE